MDILKNDVIAILSKIINSKSERNRHYSILTPVKDTKSFVKIGCWRIELSNFDMRSIKYLLHTQIVLDLDGFIREIGRRQKSFDLRQKFV